MNGSIILELLLCCFGGSLFVPFYFKMHKIFEDNSILWRKQDASKHVH